MNKHRAEIKRLSLLFDDKIKLLNDESNDINHRLALYEELSHIILQTDRCHSDLIKYESKKLSYMLTGLIVFVIIANVLIWKFNAS